MTITPEQLDQALEFVNQQLSDEASSETLMGQMSEQQPLMLAYLMSGDEEAMEEEEMEYLLYLGTVIWKAFDLAHTGLAEVTEPQLEEIEDKNAELFSTTGDDTDDLMAAAENMMEGYSQPELLAFVSDALMDDEEGISEEAMGEAFFVLKTVIDCFDAVAAKAA